MVQADGPIEENPYAAPGDGIDGSTPTSVYKFVMWSLTYRELWRIADGPASRVLMTLFKAIRLPLNIPSGVPMFDRLEVVELESLPTDAREVLREGDEACRAMGMAYQLAYRVQEVAPGPGSFATLWLSEDGATKVCQVAVRYRVGDSERLEATISAASRLRDGRWLVTGNGRAGPNAPPGYEGRHSRAWTPAEVLVEHHQWLGEVGEEVVPIAPEEVLELQSAIERELLDHFIGRGLLVPMTERELQRLMQRSEQDSLPSTPADPAVARLRWLEAMAYVLLFLVFLLVLAFTVFWWIIDPDLDRDQDRVLGRMALILGASILALGLTQIRRFVAWSRRPRPGS